MRIEEVTKSQIEKAIAAIENTPDQPGLHAEGRYRQLANVIKMYCGVNMRPHTAIEVGTALCKSNGKAEELINRALILLEHHLKLKKGTATKEKIRAALKR